LFWAGLQVQDVHLVVTAAAAGHQKQIMTRHHTPQWASGIISSRITATTVVYQSARCHQNIATNPWQHLSRYSTSIPMHYTRFLIGCKRDTLHKLI